MFVFLLIKKMITAICSSICVLLVGCALKIKKITTAICTFICVLLVGCAFKIKKITTAICAIICVLLVGCSLNGNVPVWSILPYTCNIPLKCQDKKLIVHNTTEFESLKSERLVIQESDGVLRSDNNIKWLRKPSSLIYEAIKDIWRSHGGLCVEDMDMQDIPTLTTCLHECSYNDTNQILTIKLSAYVTDQNKLKHKLFTYQKKTTKTEIVSKLRDIINELMLWI